MILQLQQAMEIGKPGKQRLVFDVLKNGNLVGLQLYQGSHFIHTFSKWEVKKGEIVVLFIDKGDAQTKIFPDAVCHFLFLGERINYWEAPHEPFRLIFPKP